MSATPTPADAKTDDPWERGTKLEAEHSATLGSLPPKPSVSTPPADAGPTEAEKDLLDHLQEELDPNCGGTTARALRFVRSHVASCLAEHALAAQPAVREFYERRLASLEADLAKAKQDTAFFIGNAALLQADNERLREIRMGSDNRLAGIIADAIIRELGGLEIWPESRRQILLHCIERAIWDASPPPSPSAGAEKQE